MRTGWIVGGIVLSAFVGCREATSVVLELTTDVPCESVRGVAISAGPTNVAAENASPLAVTLACDGSYIGSLTLVPAGADNGSLAVRVALAIDQSVEACTRENEYAGCIVARRQLSYRPHTSLRIPVHLTATCKNVSCDVVSTCSRSGACVDARDPSEEGRGPGPGVVEDVPPTRSDVDASAPPTASQPDGAVVEDVPPAPPPIVEDGLVLHLDAAHATKSGTSYARGCAPLTSTWKDISAGEHDATLGGFAACDGSTGWNGNGTAANPYRLSFDGINDYATAFVWPHGYMTITLGAWVYVRGSGGMILGSGDGAFHRALSVLPSAGRWRVFAGAGSTDSTTPVVLNRWTHAMVVYAENETTLYLNGKAVWSTDAVASGFLDGTSLQIGRASASDSRAYFDGDVADVTVYGRELNAAEVKQNCDAMRGRFADVSCR